METKTLGIMIALSIVLIISGVFLMSYTTIGTIPYTITYPYQLPGVALVAVGGILLSISLVLLVGIVLIREAKAPKIKAKKQKIVEVEERDYTSRLMTDLKFGIFSIAAGFLIRLLFVNVIAKDSTDSGTIISLGDWVLILFVIIGLLGIGIGIAEYAIAGKKRR